MLYHTSRAILLRYGTYATESPTLHTHGRYRMVKSSRRTASSGAEPLQRGHVSSVTEADVTLLGIHMFAWHAG